MLETMLTTLTLAGLVACSGPAPDDDPPSETSDTAPHSGVETGSETGGETGAETGGDTGAVLPEVLDLTGAIAPVHDPAIVAVGAGKYLVFSTGQGIEVHESSDLVQWSAVGSVFAEKPSWITTTDPYNPNHLWAPDVSFFGGQYHLYYSASRFGSNESCIGHATSASLDPPTWIDQGSAVVCSQSTDNYNAIDPAVIVDDAGRPWLAFGSFWSGLKLVALQDDGTLDGTTMRSLSSRPSTAVEAPFLVRRGDYYYLFQSVDRCCQGKASTYKIMVGRSASVTGPYVDQQGIPMLSGGGTLLVTGAERWRGPGHNAVLATPDGHFNVYHSYDADNGGIPTLRIARMEWTDDGWPVSGGP